MLASGEMKSLAQALTRALVTGFYCQWNSNTGNTRHRAKEPLPPAVPDLGLQLVAFPGHRAGNWRKLGTYPAQLRSLSVAWSNYFQLSGRQGQASKSGLLHLGAPQEFLSPQKCGLWLLFVLASY